MKRHDFRVVCQRTKNTKNSHGLRGSASINRNEMEGGNACFLRTVAEARRQIIIATKDFGFGGGTFGLEGVEANRTTNDVRRKERSSWSTARFLWHEWTLKKQGKRCPSGVPNTRTGTVALRTDVFTRECGATGQVQHSRWVKKHNAFSNYANALKTRTCILQA